MKLTPEQHEAAKKLLIDCFFSNENFSNFFMRDDEKVNFSVPTRYHRIISNVPAFQSDLFKRLDKIHETHRLAVASPRGFMKSTTCSIEFPLWAALFGHYKEILIVSNSEALAINFLRSIKVNIESNERIHRYYGKMWSDKWTETHLILSNKVSIRAVGWGAQIRGFRPDLIILDDIESDETVASEDIRKKMKEWVLKAAINSLTVDGNMIWVGTLINRLSLLYDWIHNPPAGWNVVFNKAYIDGVEEPGHELWPDVWPHARLAQRKAEIGTFAFSSEFMNEPMPSDGNRFNPNSFSYFTDKDLEGKSLGAYISIDPAFSENKSADYGVIMVVLHDAEDNLYVDRYTRKHTTARGLIDDFKGIYKFYASRIRTVGIEDVGPQKAFYQQLTSECYQEGIYAPFKKLTGMINTKHGVARNKQDRITYAIQPRLEAGKVKFRHEQVELLNELTLFPESKNDDTIDALAYAIALIEPMQDYSHLQQTEEDYQPVSVDHGVTGYGETYGEKEADLEFNIQ